MTAECSTAERGVVKVDGEVLTGGAECFCGRGRLVGQICDQFKSVARGRELRRPRPFGRPVLVYKCAEPVWFRAVVSITFSLLLCQVMMSATRAHAGHPPASHIRQ